MRRNSAAPAAAFTLVELIVAAGVFGLFAAALIVLWSALQTQAVNAANYARRQSDQSRVLDYLRRDIRRAASVEVYSGGTPVTGTNPGGELRVTVLDYYTDNREEDHALGPSTTYTPTLTGSTVTYGPPITVRYFVANGAVVREEAGVVRAVADAAGGFLLIFNREADGDVRCRVSYQQPMVGPGSRVLRRQVELLCRERSTLQL